MENFLYAGTNPHVHNDGDDGGDEEEVGANSHHEQEAGVNYSDEWWTWMQTEVQRISTDQERQGVEMAGLRNNFQRGNQINEYNNQMLRNMMHTFTSKVSELSSSSSSSSSSSFFFFFFFFFLIYCFVLIAKAM